MTVVFNDDDEVKIVDAIDTSEEEKGRNPSDVKVKLTYKRLDEAPIKETEFKVLLKLTGIGNVEDRSALDLIAVLDVSGSMGEEKGTKLKNMKGAMKFVINKLTPCDRLSIVTFNGATEKKCRLMQMAGNAPVEIVKIVDELKAGGSTNILAGLELAKQLLDGRKFNDATRAPAIILMSDGQDTDGQRVEGVLQVSPIKYPTYTFGFGSKQDAPVLNDIAVKSPGGTFHNVQNIENLCDAFSQCLAGLLTIVVQDLKLTITPKNSKIKEVLAGIYPQSKNKNDSITVSFGKLFSKEVRKVIVHLDLPDLSAKFKQTRSDILQIIQEYESSADTIRSQIINIRRTDKPKVTQELKSILIEEDRLKTLKVIKDARSLADSGNLADARLILDKAQNSLQDAIYGPNPKIDILKYEVKQLLGFMISPEIYKEKGRPYSLSCETSHDRQRYALRGDPDKLRLFTTPRMDTYLKQSKNFVKDPSKPPPSANEDLKQELAADPFSPVTQPLSQFQAMALQALTQNDALLKDVKTVQDLQLLLANIRTAIQALQQMQDTAIQFLLKNLNIQAAE